MSGEPVSSPVLVLRGRVCSEVFGVVPTRIQSIRDIKFVSTTSNLIDIGDSVHYCQRE